MVPAKAGAPRVCTGEWGGTGKTPWGGACKLAQGQGAGAGGQEHRNQGLSESVGRVHTSHMSPDSCKGPEARTARPLPATLGW